MTINTRGDYRYELRNVYNIDDILDMYETCMVYLHNKAVILEEGGKR